MLLSRANETGIHKLAYEDVEEGTHLLYGNVEQSKIHKNFDVLFREHVHYLFHVLLKEQKQLLLQMRIYLQRVTSSNENLSPSSNNRKYSVMIFFNKEITKSEKLKQIFETAIFPQEEVRVILYQVKILANYF
ncbi:hypothetical protein ACJX0J_035808 [Zea mays]